MVKEKVLDDVVRREIEELFDHVPYRAAACIEALKVVQKHYRWVSDEALEELGVLLEMSPHQIDSVATFYNMIFRRPVARHIIHVCNSVSCWILGYESILDHLQQKLKISYGESTPDDRFTLLPIPCLGTCDRAPALMIDTDLYRDLTTEQLDEILEKYE